MKLIEPIENLVVLSTSDAPIDAIDTWTPTGRDSLQYISKPVFDVIGDVLIIASSTTSGLIYKVDLVTGAVVNTGVQTTLSAINIKISPDGSYFYLCDKTNASGIRHKIFNTTDWAQEYISSVSVVGGGISDGQVANNAQWSSDSLKLNFNDVNILREITVASSTETNSVSIFAGTRPFWSLIVDGAGDFISANNSSDSYTLVAVNSSFVKTIENNAVSTTELGALEYNTTTNEIVCSFGNELRLVSGIDLTIGAKLITPKIFGAIRSVATTVVHLIARSLSTAPYWNYYDLADYSFVKSLPALTDKGEIIAAGTNYTVVQQIDGIELIQNSDDSVLGQINPSVIAGDEYIYGDNIYEVLIDNDDQPDLGALLEIPTWIDGGKINPLRMFDGKLDSPTTSQNTLEITINPEQVASGIALFNVDASAIRITMTDPVEGLVYDSGDIGLIDNSGVTDWYAFYFAPYIKKSDFVTLALPPYADAEIVVTVSSVSGPVSVGEIVLGRTITLGIAQFGSSVGILDFSEKEQDQFGNFNIIERKFSKRADYDVKIPTNTVSGVQRTLSKFRATPAVWVGDESREETIVYGYYKSFDIVLSNPALSDTSILVEGL